MKKHQREATAAQGLPWGWVCNPVHCGYPTVIGPLRHHVANIHHKGAWLNAHVLPLPTFSADL